MFNKKDKETIKEYKTRLYLNKDLYGLSHQDIADLINAESKEPKSESVYRKWWKAYREGVLDTEEKYMEQDGLLESYQASIIELEKAKVKYSDNRGAYKALIKNEARFEELKDILIQNLNKKTPPKKYKEHKLRKPSKKAMLIGLNDIHFGADIKNYWNEYNSDIAYERLSLYLSNILKIKELHEIDECFVCANGDLISGTIHYTIQLSNKENITEQIMGVSKLISWFLEELSKKFEQVTFSEVAGNHSRVASKSDSPKNERLDDLIPWYLKADLEKFDNINILDNNIDTTVNVVNICGLNYLNVHGDYDNFGTCQKIIDMIDQPIYCIHMGHLHHNKSDWSQGYKVIMSGSLQGIDDFCIQKRIYGKAQQLVCICNENGIECQYDIILQ